MPPNKYLLPAACVAAIVLCGTAAMSFLIFQPVKPVQSTFSERHPQQEAEQIADKPSQGGGSVTSSYQDGLNTMAETIRATGYPCNNPQKIAVGSRGAAIRCDENDYVVAVNTENNTVVVTPRY